MAWLHVIRSPSLDQQCCSKPQHAAAARIGPSDSWSVVRVTPGPSQVLKGVWSIEHPFGVGVGGSPARGLYGLRPSTSEKPGVLQMPIIMQQRWRSVAARVASQTSNLRH